jgi:hypothetical protein
VPVLTKIRFFLREYDKVRRPRTDRLLAARAGVRLLCRGLPNGEALGLCGRRSEPPWPSGSGLGGSLARRSMTSGHTPLSAGGDESSGDLAQRPSGPRVVLRCSPDPERVIATFDGVQRHPVPKPVDRPFEQVPLSEGVGSPL